MLLSLELGSAKVFFSTSNRKNPNVKQCRCTANGHKAHAALRYPSHYSYCIWILLWSRWAAWSPFCSLAISNLFLYTFVKFSASFSLLSILLMRWLVILLLSGCTEQYSMLPLEKGLLFDTINWKHFVRFAPGIIKCKLPVSWTCRCGTEWWYFFFMKIKMFYCLNRAFTSLEFKIRPYVV